MLNETLQHQRNIYAARVNKVGKIKLAVLAMDGLHIATHKSQSQEHLRRLYSSKIKSNAVVSTVISSPDGLPKFVGCLSASLSRANTDERIAATLMQLNNDGLTTGSLLDFLMGPMKNQGLDVGEQPFHDFFTVLLIDKGNLYIWICNHYLNYITKNNLNNSSSLDSFISYITGYKTFGHLGIGIVSFVQFLDGLVQLTGGRFQYRFPPDNAAHWLVIITVATQHITSFYN
jgi:hypothetical protein